MMRPSSPIATALLVVAAVVAAFVPLAGRQPAVRPAEGFPGWPAHYEDRTLVQLPLTAIEAAFAREFPGHTGRFSDGRREIIVRWVNEPTRRLHSASDCFRGSGYSIAPLPNRRDASGRLMGCFRATSAGARLAVCEVIHDEGGRSWPDVSAWFWHALFQSNQRSWWSYVVAEMIAADGSPL